MPETDTIPVSASVASTGPGIRYIGDHVYAYSGTISVSGSLTELLNFNVGTEYLVGSLELHGTFAQIGQSQIRINILLNEQSIIDTYWEQALDATFLDYPTKLVIPPLTDVIIQMSQASGVNRNMQATFIARAYGEK